MALRWRITVDKGEQSSGGDDAVVVGTIANTNLDPETADGLTYALMVLDSAGLDLTATTDVSGRLWVFVGYGLGVRGQDRGLLRQHRGTARRTSGVGAAFRSRTTR
jgi:hypothetical protein